MKRYLNNCVCQSDIIQINADLLPIGLIENKFYDIWIKGFIQ